MNYWPYLLVFLLLVVMLVLSRRNRQRQVSAEAERSSRIAFGSEVMTTSGLYGTVVARNDDDETVQLAIAPGIEVKWALAALRDVASLPGRYRRGIDGEGGAPGQGRMGKPRRRRPDDADPGL
ncbi:MAG: preprotein translocase subunit YajC [Jatrophihabitantaceae bacterium]